MSERATKQYSENIETDDKITQKPQTTEALHDVQSELQEQGIRTLTDYNVLLDTPEGGKYAAWIGAAKLIFELITNYIPEKDKKKDEKEGSSSKGSIGSKKSKEKDEKDDKRRNEIAKKLEEKKKKLQKPKEVSSVPLVSKEKFPPNNIFYVGDSYMGGITRKRVKQNKYVKGSRPFVAFGKKSKKLWGGNDVETVAHKALDNPNCKLLVLTGGVNDFFSYGNPRKTYERVRAAYQGIIDRAKEKGVKVVIYKIPKIKKIPVERSTGKKRYEKKEKIDMYTDMLNGFLDKKWILNEESNMNVIDTNVAIGDNWGDSIHPNKKGYENLYKEIQDQIS